MLINFSYCLTFPFQPAYWIQPTSLIQAGEKSSHQKRTHSQETNKVKKLKKKLIDQVIWCARQSAVSNKSNLAYLFRSSFSFFFRSRNRRTQAKSIKLNRKNFQIAAPRLSNHEWKICEQEKKKNGFLYQVCKKYIHNFIHILY
jgi:hypothetical protein